MMIDKRLVNFSGKAKKYVYAAVLLRAAGLVSSTVFIFCAGKIITIAKNSNTFDFTAFVFPLGLMALCLLITVFSNLFASRLASLSSVKVKIALRSKIYEKLLFLGSDYYEKTTTAKIIQLAVEGVEQIETWFAAFLPQFYYSMAASVFTFAVIAFLNLKMAIALLLCVPLIPISMATVQGIAKKILTAYWAQYANLADSFLENLQGLTTLQIYEADAFKAKQMANEAETFRRVTMKVLSMQLNSIIIMDIIAYGGAALGIIFALSSFYEGSLTLENAFVCILLSADFFIPLRRLGSAFHTAMNGVTASKNIFELLDMENDSCRPECQFNHEVQPQNALIQTKNLSYSFDRTVLHNAEITIKQGEFVAFTGKSGSGKSTMAKILCGIYKNYSGSVLLNGVELSKIPFNELYDFVTYISHRDWIFAGTVRECLLEANEKAADSQMIQVLKDVQLWDFLSENGALDFTVSEGAANLSGGQKQRLSIARALLHDSELYVFDEAASNIDVESEEAILKVIYSLRGKKTVIMISHRKENASGADRVYEFEKDLL